MQKSILIDATHITGAQPTGVERYTRELIPLISRLLIQGGWHVTWVGHAKPEHVPEGVHWLTSRYIPFWSQRGIARVLAHGTYGVYFTPSGTAPIGVQAKTVMTVHDLSAVHYPHAYSLAQRIKALWWIPRVARSLARVIVPSTFVGRDLSRYWGVSKDQIITIPHGAIPLSVESEKPDWFQGDAPYVFYQGRIEVKKNLSILLQSFALLAHENTAIRLILAGKPGIGSEEIYREIASLPEVVRERIVTPGYVTDAEQRYLYDHALVVVVPSHMEGFGFPVLEAFQAKVPVIIANGGSLPEIARDAAIAADPNNPQDWFHALVELTTNHQKRSELIELGTKVLRGFSWDMCAKQTAEAIDSLAE